MLGTIHGDRRNVNGISIVLSLPETARPAVGCCGSRVTLLLFPRFTQASICGEVLSPIKPLPSILSVPGSSPALEPGVAIGAARFAVAWSIERSTFRSVVERTRRHHHKELQANHGERWVERTIHPYSCGAIRVIGFRRLLRHGSRTRYEHGNPMVSLGVFHNTIAAISTMPKTAQQTALRCSWAIQYPAAALKHRIALVHPLAQAAGLLIICRILISEWYQVSGAHFSVPRLAFMPTVAIRRLTH